MPLDVHVQVVWMGHPFKDVFRVSSCSGRQLFGFGEGAHQRRNVPDPSDGLIRLDLFHVPLLCVLLYKLEALGSFGLQSVEGGLSVAPVSSVHRSETGLFGSKVISRSWLPLLRDMIVAPHNGGEVVDHLRSFRTSVFELCDRQT